MATQVESQTRGYGKASLSRSMFINVSLGQGQTGQTRSKPHILARTDCLTWRLQRKKRNNWAAGTLCKIRPK